MLRFVLASTLLAAPFAFAQPPDSLPDRFAEQLVLNLQSDVPAIQESAIQMLIEHPDWADARAAQFDLVRLYRDSPNRGERLLALRGLEAMESPWAMGFLKRHAWFEKDEQIAKLSALIAQEYFSRDEVEVGAPTYGIAAAR
jgi:hypothetical protein